LAFLRTKVTGLTLLSAYSSIAVEGISAYS
jgi:hypothetical protein